jgi:hypothetical protein
MTIQKPASVAYPPGEWDGRPAHRVCTSVNSEGLRQLYRATLTGAAHGR